MALLEIFVWIVFLGVFLKAINDDRDERAKAKAIEEELRAAIREAEVREFKKDILYNLSPEEFKKQQLTREKNLVLDAYVWTCTIVFIALAVLMLSIKGFSNITGEDVSLMFTAPIGLGMMVSLFALWVQNWVGEKK